MTGRLTQGLRQTASPFLILGLMFYLYGLLHKDDWGHAFVKLFCFAALFTLIVFLRSRTGLTEAPSHFVRLELIAWTIILVSIVVSYGRTYGPGLFSPPRVDIGYTTVNAASMLFVERKNPYSSPDINRRPELLPRYRGFHYGPLMLLGYLPAVLSPGLGYKLSSLTYLFVSALLLSLLVHESKEGSANRLARITYVLCLFLLAERFWYEIFSQGANDIFPVSLLLASLVALKDEKYFLTGIFLGLSFAAKFSPAMFLLIALLRKDLKKSIVKGFTLGLIPLLGFAIWDIKGLFNNVFRIRLTIPYDSTSLYSELPPAYHLVLPLALFAAITFSLYRNIELPLEYENVLVTFALLLIIGEVTFKEMHANHLIWFYPLFALILERAKYQLTVGAATITT